MALQTEQEVFWQGEFGNQYTDRNQGLDCLAANIYLFSKILAQTSGIQSILELGSNRGLNLEALKHLLPRASVSAVEINKKALEVLKENLPDAETFPLSILDFKSIKNWDLVFTKGVLIHINPDKLSEVYSLLYQRSSRYILVAEYYNPQPTQISYRGHSDKLYKRDFAGDLLDKYSDLELVNYGFSYHRDPQFPQDDISWFLLEKK